MTARQNWLKTCPLCGGNNQCAMAAGETKPCWCQGVTIDPDALAQIPPDSVGKRCLCPSCGRITGDTSDAR